MARNWMRFAALFVVGLFCLAVVADADARHGRRRGGGGSCCGCSGGGYYGGGYAPAYYGGYYDNPYPVVRYRRVVRPAYAYYGGGPRYYGARYYGHRYYGPRYHRHW